MTYALSYSLLRRSPHQKIFGIQVAIEDLVASFLRYGRQEIIPFFVRSPLSQTEIETLADRLAVSPNRLRFFLAPNKADNFKGIDTIFRVDPMPGNLLFERQASPDNGFAFCGLAHAMAGEDAGKILRKYCLDPTQVGDALICPSRAIQSVLRSFFDSYEDFLKTKFNTTFRTPVELPLIPLGTDIERLQKRASPEKRARQRAQLGLSEDDIAILWVGRLSALVKTHPLVLFRAVEEAHRQTGKNVTFILHGYFAPKEAEQDFRRLAHDFCPTTPVRFIESQDPAYPDGLWAAADIFLSLIDNIQESFGLTPIEAIAAGLPRVLSDWDGYKDCVTDGEDGFAIPTLLPPPHQGASLVEPLMQGGYSYADYIGRTALCTNISIDKAAKALAALIASKDLRAQMAAKARSRLSTYDWKNIIPRYEELHEELAHKRASALNSHSPFQRG